MMPEILAVGVCAIAAAAGYLLGRRHEREAAAEHTERMLRVEPPQRTPGQPTNRSAEPSRVAKPRFQTTHNWRP